MNKNTLFKILKILKEDNCSTEEIYSIITNLFRMYLTRKMQDQITKVIDNVGLDKFVKDSSLNIISELNK